MKKLLPKTNITRLLWLVVIFGIVFCGAYTYSLYHQKLTTSHQLSSRATEFLSKQRATGSSVWNEHHVADPNAPAATPTASDASTHCFLVHFPFAVQNIHVEEDETTCAVRGRMVSPAGQLVIAQHQSTGALTEDTGVQLRQRETEKYTPKEVVVTGYDQVLGFQEAEGYTFFLKKDDILITVAINQMPQPQLLTDAELLSLLQSIVLL